MKASRTRIKEDIETIARFGGLSEGGVTRLALSKEDMDGRKYLIEKMKEAGLNVTIDAVGNTIGRREGKKKLAPIMIGSHLDTVPCGGNYDGIAGVIAALETIRMLNDEGVETVRPIEVVNFTAEESSRFLTATMGSKCMKGSLTIDKIKSLKDKNGNSFYDALSQAGFEPDKLDSVKKYIGDYHAFIELHIEQGPVLEAEKKPIGIVTFIAAPTRMKINIKGKADHSGNTPMNMRRDALAGASEIILALEKIASEEAGRHTVGTVGDVRVTPGAMNVIPGEVELLVDIRDIDMNEKRKAYELFIESINEVASKRNLIIERELLVNDTPVQMSAKIINTIQEATESLGYPYKIMHSGAGHDAMNLVPITDVGMIFIPSVDGISHNIKEFTEMEDICNGADVLYASLYKLAMEDQ
ncbi:Zn-dependent hydrolase [Mesobacillus zeae]|uniref:Zn-dependent hydrolase n=1 Tax=Mesobacillus zeae TaxID=1917180 RepID=A0A398BBJ8_9BACI|nr:Zn-dependent hydrolase [Mesobacillus zeae]